MSDSIPANSAPEFALAMRGYDRLQVDTYLDRLREQLEECTTRLRRAEERATTTARERDPRIAELEDQLAALQRDRLDPTGSTGSSSSPEVGQALERAAAEAEAITRRAAREAETILEQARRRGRELERERAAGQDRLQRQLRDLRDTVTSLLSAADAADGHAESEPHGVPTGSQADEPVPDERVSGAHAPGATAGDRVAG